MLALALCAATESGCDSSAADDSGSLAPSRAGATSSDAGASGDVEPGPTSVNFGSQTAAGFVVKTSIDLDPKATQELTVQTDPPGSFLIHFDLPGTSSGTGADDAPGDAALDHSDAQTDANGFGHVVLTAPSTPAQFSVRASADSKLLGLLGVTVSSRGYTTLQVMPSYNGHRPVDTWTATASVANGVTCSQFAGNPPPDGDRVGTASPKEELQISRVPVGADLIITLRAGHYIYGCAALPALSEGDGNTVLVYASDRPLNLADSVLDLAFGPSDARPAFDKLLGTSVTLAESALLGDATSDVAALLNAMQAATPSADRAAFTAARVQGNWDTALSAAFGKSATRRVRDPAERWLNAGLAALDVANAFTGKLSADGDQAVFALSSVSGVSASSAGFARHFAATWSADSSDTVLLGTELSWVPSSLVTALAEAPALLEFPAASSVPEALSLSVDCDLVANVLLENGANAGSALYAGCDAGCGSSTCSSALANLWSQAQAASGSDTASLSVTATGSATVGDTAEIIDLTGTWVGQLSEGSEQAAASGALSASSAE